MAATVEVFQRNYRLAVWSAYAAAALGLVGGGIYVYPVFTGTSAIYGDYRPEWEFWNEKAGLVSLAGLLIALLSLRASWFCLNWKGKPGEGLNRQGQSIVTRSMTIAGLTIIGVASAWMVRGIF